MNATDYLRQRSDNTARRTVIAAVGVGALVLAVLSAFVPVVGDVVAGSVGFVFGNRVLVVLASLVGGGYGLAHLYWTGKDEATEAPLVGLDPERAHYTENHISGEDIDQSVDAVGGELPESSAKNWWTYREKNDVTSTLTDLTVRVLANEHDVDRDQAAKMVESGSWTEDARAAAFLGGEEASALPLRVQFVDWLSGEAYQRRVEATVDAIARHAGVTAEATGDSERESSVARTASESALPMHEVPEVDSDSDADGELAVDDLGAGSVPSTADVGPFEAANATDVSLSEPDESADESEETTVPSDAETAVLGDETVATNTGGDDT